jgi:hypothetical protein
MQFSRRIIALGFLILVILGHFWLYWQYAGSTPEYALWLFLVGFFLVAGGGLLYLFHFILDQLFIWRNSKNGNFAQNDDTLNNFENKN